VDCVIPTATNKHAVATHFAMASAGRHSLVFVHICTKLEMAEDAKRIRANHVVVDGAIMLMRVWSLIGALISKPDILCHVISFIHHLDVVALGILDRVISDDRYRPDFLALLQ
jgi:hypothetical protein